MEGAEDKVPDSCRCTSVWHLDHRFSFDQKPSSRRHMAMGQNPVPPVNIPILTKID